MESRFKAEIVYEKILKDCAPLNPWRMNLLAISFNHGYRFF